MAQLSLNATKRQVVGKKARTVAQQGKLPGVLYGHGLDTVALELNQKDFLQVFKKAGENTLIDLNVDGQSRPVLIHEVQRHYLKDHPIHVDFYAVRMDEKLKAHIPLHFVGESPAVKALGGILVKNLSEVEVECLPADLPPAFEVDISKLETFDHAIRVADLQISDKVKILAHPEEVIANVAAPRSEAELAELEQAPVAVDVSAIEGVAEKPKEGEEAEEGEPMEVPKEQPAAEKKDQGK